MYILTAQQMKQAETVGVQQGIPYSKMMDSAGTAAANLIIKRYPAVLEQSVTVLCGNGNNGGDGFVVARRLQEKGVAVHVILVQGEPQTITALEMLGRLKGTSVNVVDWQREGSFARRLLAESTLVVDGVFGIGFHGALPDFAREIFALCTRLNRIMVALDIPSGAVADLGTVAEGTPKCDYTVAFHTYKYAHILYPASDFCGEIAVADIGLDYQSDQGPTVLEREAIAKILVRPTGDTHKGTFGKATVLAGSFGMAGAAVFAVRACLRCGVGLTVPVVPKSIYPLVAQAAPEGVYRVYEDHHSMRNVASLCVDGNALLMGCGMGNTEFTAGICCELTQNYPNTLVVDADGINSLGIHIHELEKRKGATILTPHPLELARLLQTDVAWVQANRFQAATQTAKRLGAVVVLKGAKTIIADADGTVAVNLTGNNGLSKGGSGDVLAGMIVSLAAQGMPPFDAAKAGVWLHGTAADLCAKQFSKRAMLPSDIIETLPLLFSQFES